MSDIEKAEVHQISENISSTFNRFGLTLPLSPDDMQDYNQLKNFLTEKLRGMLDSNFNLLVNTLYRIDVNEEKLNVLFGSKNRFDIPSALADLIIERQLQKIQFRKKYKDGKI